MKKPTFAAVALAAAMTAFAPFAHGNTPGRDDAPAQLAGKERTLADLIAARAAQEGVDPATTGSVAAARQQQARAAVSAARGAPAGSPYDEIIARHAARHGVSPALAHAVIRIESNYRANARGRAGEVGLMQIKPATARMMGYSGAASGLYDPETNIRYGMKYLAGAQQLGGGDLCGTILRYNAGHGARRMNRVSAAYCAKVKRQIGQS